MINTELENSFLVRQFNGLYRDILKSASLVRSSAGRAHESPEDKLEADDELFQSVQGNIRSRIEKNALAAGRYGSEFGQVVYRDAQYAMVAFADEVFLNIDWEGRAWWKKNLLEEFFFGSHVAGEKIFRKAEEIVRESDTAFREVAAVYHRIFSLGFKGKMRGSRDLGEIEVLKFSLHRFLFREDPSLSEKGRQLFSESYLYTLKNDKAARLPHAGRWVLAVLLIIGIYFYVSHGLWVHSISELSDLVQGIFDLGGEI